MTLYSTKDTLKMRLQERKMTELEIAVEKIKQAYHLS